MSNPLLVIDVGTTGVRAACVSEAAQITESAYREILPSTPAEGIVEQDATALVAAVESVAEEALASRGPAAALGITVQRATTVVWDASSGEPVGPAIGWQDLRTLGDCMMLAAQGFAVAPNMSATKAAFLKKQALEAGTDPEALRFGTLDTWLTWKLSGATSFVTDPTNACVTGLTNLDGISWNAEICEALELPVTMLPEIVPSAAVVGEARIAGQDIALASRAGDQQASLVGQGGLAPGVVKTTYGTAAMTDVNVGSEAPNAKIGAAGTYPVVAVQTNDQTLYGREATVITAGEAIRAQTEFGVAESPEELAELAATVDSAGGVQFVPASLGLGTPHWDYGARSAFLGMSLATGRAEIARAVLEGVASSVTECVTSLEADSGLTVTELRADGGAAASDVLLQAQADQLGIPVARSREREATVLGTGMLAGLATGAFDAATLSEQRNVDRVFEPVWDDTRREQHRADWARAIEAVREWVPALSTLDFFGTADA